MKKITSLLFYLILILLLNSCVSDSPTQPKDNLTEPKELKELMSNVTTALKNNDADAFIKCFSEQSAKYYSKVITENKSKLTDFAEILETRKLITSDSIYAVYQVTYNGMTFEITMIRDDDGKWKLRDM